MVDTNNLPEGTLLRHVKSGKLYRVTGLWTPWVDGSGNKIVYIFGQRDGRDFGPVRNVAAKNAANYELVADAGAR